MESQSSGPEVRFFILMETGDRHFGGKGENLAQDRNPAHSVRQATQSGADDDRWQVLCGDRVLWKRRSSGRCNAARISGQRAATFRAWTKVHCVVLLLRPNLRRIRGGVLWVANCLSVVPDGTRRRRSLASVVSEVTRDPIRLPRVWKELQSQRGRWWKARQVPAVRCSPDRSGRCAHEACRPARTPASSRARPK